MDQINTNNNTQHQNFNVMYGDMKSIAENYNGISINYSTSVDLRVISIADLMDPEVTTIPDRMLTDNWQAGTNLLWPDIPRPPKRYWATFRKCIHATFSTHAPRYQPAHFSIRLDKNLGPWHAVPQNTWYTCYKSDSQLILRQNNTNLIPIMTALKVKGYDHATGTTKILPLESHPITYQQIGQGVWTHRPTNLALDVENTRHPPGHLINNTLSDPTTVRLIIGSDGLLHLHEQVAAVAWIISTGDSKHLSTTFLMANISSYTSHRIELGGIFRTLHHLDHLNITTKMVEQWCDNKQADKYSTVTLDGPSMMIKAEADIILAIHHLRNRFPFHTNMATQFSGQN